MFVAQSLLVGLRPRGPIHRAQAPEDDVYLSPRPPHPGPRLDLAGCLVHSQTPGERRAGPSGMNTERPWLDLTRPEPVMEWGAPSQVPRASQPIVVVVLGALSPATSVSSSPTATT